PPSPTRRSSDLCKRVHLRRVIVDDAAPVLVRVPIYERLETDVVLALQIEKKLRQFRRRDTPARGQLEGGSRVLLQRCEQRLFGVESDRKMFAPASFSWICKLDPIDAEQERLVRRPIRPNLLQFTTRDEA